MIGGDALLRMEWIVVVHWPSAHPAQELRPGELTVPMLSGSALPDLKGNLGIDTMD